MFVLFVASCPETEAVYTSLALFAFDQQSTIIPSVMLTGVLNANGPAFKIRFPRSTERDAISLNTFSDLKHRVLCI